MASKKIKNNSIIGTILALVIIIAFALFGNDSQILNMLTSSASDNVESESVENLENISIITGNDCISKIPEDEYLRVYCLDVGQGDSILIVNEGKTGVIMMEHFSNTDLPSILYLLEHSGYDWAATDLKPA